MLDANKLAATLCASTSKLVPQAVVKSGNAMLLTCRRGLWTASARPILQPLTPGSLGAFRPLAALAPQQDPAALICSMLAM